MLCEVLAPSAAIPNVWDETAENKTKGYVEKRREERKPGDYPLKSKEAFYETALRALSVCNAIKVQVAETKSITPNNSNVFGAPASSTNATK